MRGGERGEMLAVAETDLERAWRGTPEELIQRQDPRRVLDAVCRPEILERARLADGHPAGAHHETADGAIVKRVVGH